MVRPTGCIEEEPVTLSEKVLPIFDGTEDAYWWLIQLDRYFEANRWISEKMKVDWVTLFALRGEASLWWYSWKKNHQSATWKEFEMAFIKNFIPDLWDMLEVAEDEENQGDDHILTENNEESKNSGVESVIEEDQMLVDKRNEEEEISTTDWCKGTDVKGLTLETKKMQEPLRSMAIFLNMDITGSKEVKEFKGCVESGRFEKINVSSTMVERVCAHKSYLRIEITIEADIRRTICNGTTAANLATPTDQNKIKLDNTLFSEETTKAARC
ncbi:uncharacterized protein LOC131636510 isoform X2 [Vicia villosa]|uniref:uncharacterized protein LOC131636510 isoform X2 n=1 Tax=Vicia villosa TaxID=3911 RepID=UPI00273C894B|nr:uncharacterized protein LOC131636510 isoform X2 [Vicia villosa]